MSITQLSTHPEMSEAEWQIRCDLAAVYRILHHFRMTDLIYTHMTARIPGEEGTFLINNYGDMFDEITASSLVKMDMDGNVIGDNDSYNEAGFTIHSGVYRARPDVNCILHTHSRDGTAVSMTKSGLLPISQDALLVMNELGYHDYGTPASQSECEALGKSCQGVNCVILRNHGLLALGPTIQSAFVRLYFLEHACSEQVAAASLNDEFNPIDPTVIDEAGQRFTQFHARPESGAMEWAALLRMLERKGDNYRC